VSDSRGPNSGDRTDEIAAEVRIDLSPANGPGHEQAVGGIEETNCETTTCLINTRSIQSSIVHTVFLTIKRTHSRYFSQHT